MKIKIEANNYGINEKNVWKLQSLIPKDRYKYLMELTNNTINELFFKTLFNNSDDIYFHYVKKSHYNILYSYYSWAVDADANTIKINLEETFNLFSLDEIEEAIEKIFCRGSKLIN